MKFLAVFSMDPQDGLGGCKPRPRKDRLASAMMALAIMMVACTIRAGMTLGRICRKIMRVFDAPSERVLWTKSSFLMASPCHRARRMHRRPAEAPMHTMVLNTLGPQ